MKQFLFLITVTGLLFFSLNKSGEFQSRSIEESELQVLSDIILADSVPTVYYKTIITDINQPLSRHLYYLNSFELCTSLENLDSLKMDRDERDYLVERFTSMETENINKLIREHKNATLKDLKGHDWLIISLPVIFRDGKYAIYYSIRAYGGQFNLMKNIDGKWKNICYSYVWTA